MPTSRKNASRPVKRMGVTIATTPRKKSSKLSIVPTIGGFDEVNKKYNNAGDAPPGQSIVNGSLKLPYVYVNLIFWGSEWSNPNPPVTSASVVAAVNNIRSGTYLHGLHQYGFINAWIKQVITIPNDPPNPFTVTNIRDFVYGLIDNETLPEPDEESFITELHVVFTPTNVAFTQPTPTSNINGFHSNFAWDDYDIGDIDNSDYYYAWVQNNGTLNGITQVFSHELAEAITDPAGSGIQVVPANSTNWNEIGDVCQSAAILNGVNVQSYWSQADQACIIPTFVPPPPPPVVEKGTTLQIIAIRKKYSAYAKHEYISQFSAIDNKGIFWILDRSEVFDLLDKNGNTFIVKGKDGTQSHVIEESHWLKTSSDNSLEDNLLSLPYF
jgi:hypothetical protein